MRRTYGTLLLMNLFTCGEREEEKMAGMWNLGFDQLVLKENIVACYELV